MNNYYYYQIKAKKVSRTCGMYLPEGKYIYNFERDIAREELEAE
jgi:hypothetical protein